MLVIQIGVDMWDHTGSAVATVVEGKSACKQCLRMLLNAGFGILIPAAERVVHSALPFLG
jgi:hypothetical protein